MDVAIRRTEEKDGAAVRELFFVCFGKEMSRAEWLWKYKASPLGSASWVALCEGKIVSHYGGIRLSLHLGGRRFDAYEGCDVMTHPGYRARPFSKKGLYLRLAERFFSENPAEFIFGFPPERHGRLMSLKLGFAPHRPLEVLTKEAGDFGGGKPGLMLKKSAGWESLSPDEMDLIWDASKDRLGLSIEKTSPYMLWRYKEHPARTYVPLTIRQRPGGKLRAFAVVHPSGEGLNVMDFFIQPFDRRTLKALFSHIEGFAKKEKTKKITLWANPSEALHREIKALGFRSEKGISYIFKSMTGTPDAASLMDSYSYRLGDYDAA